MYPVGASGVVGVAQAQTAYSPLCSCPSSPSAIMIERSLGNATCFRAELLPPHTSSTAVLRQTCDVTLRSPSRVRGQIVENVRIRSPHNLSNASQVSSRGSLGSESNFVSTASRKFRQGRSSTVLVNAEAQHPNLFQDYATEHIHSNGVSSDARIDDHSNGSGFSPQESLRPEHVFVQPNGAPPFSAKEFETDLEIEAWELLRSSVATYGGSPVGTIAAQDPTTTAPLNYDQVFIRDFIPSAIAFLLKGEPEIVRGFLLNTLRLQSWEKTVDCYDPGQGLMPASFKVRTVPADGDDENATEEILDPDFGEAAIGRVAPVDSGLWWIILLRAYGKHTGDYSLQERLDVQTGMKMILRLCLSDGFDMFPTLLVTDGSCMIDRRMGIHGHPLEIQALFYSALRCAREMLIDEDTGLARSVNSRLSALLFHIREYYWLDMKKLNVIYRYQTEEYSHEAVNKFNIYPDQIPGWLLDWMPDEGGYLIGNLQPAHMDFRVFSLGNLWSIVGSLSSEQQSAGILELIEARWKDFVGNMPFKIAFPALEMEEWRIITGADPKNTPWSYHNSGSWPVLLWQFTVACIKMGRQDLAQRAIEVAEQRLSGDRWPEYYDTRFGRLIGKQARLQQTWTIAGFLVAKMLLKNPEAASMLICDEDPHLFADPTSPENNPRKRRGGKKRELV